MKSIPIVERERHSGECGSGGTVIEQISTTSIAVFRRTRGYGEDVAGLRRNSGVWALRVAKPSRSHTMLPACVVCHMFFP